MGIRFYNLNGFFVKKLAHGVFFVTILPGFPNYEISVKREPAFYVSLRAHSDTNGEAI